MLETLEGRQLLSQTPYLGGPFTIGATPVTIQAEDYDLGGQGVAYNDTSTNNTGGQYRPNEAVDIMSHGTGQHRVGGPYAGEWLEYTIDVSQAGAYEMEFRVSQTDGGSTFHAEVDGVNVTGSLTAPDTNSFNTFASVRATVTLAAGVQVLRLALDANAPNGYASGFDWIRIAGQSPYLGAPFAVGATPVTIQAEDYDLGGQGLAYNDTSTNNTGGQYRPDESVDIMSHGTGLYRVGGPYAGEWMEYTIDVAQAGTYESEFRVSQADAGATFHAEIDGVDVTGSLAAPDTDGFDVFASVTQTVTLTAGEHVLRLALDGSAPNGYAPGFDWIKLTRQVTVPAAPSGLTAEPISATQISLAWADNATDETAFEVQQSPDGVNGWTTVATPVVDATSVTVSGLSAETTYHFRVRAINTTGESAWAGPAAATTDEDPSQIPAPPTGLTATADEDELRIDLNWDDNPATPAVGHYVVYRGTTATFADAERVGTAMQSQYADSSVIGASTYHYWVTAVDGSPDESSPSGAAAATTLIPFPSTHGAEGANDREVNLIWGDPVDTEPGEDGFHIEMSDVYGQTFTHVTSVAPNATGYTITGLEPSTGYTFRVRAFRGAAVGGWATTSAQTRATPAPQEFGTVKSGISSENTQWFGEHEPGLYRMVYVSGAINYESPLEDRWGTIRHRIRFAEAGSLPGSPGSPDPLRGDIDLPGSYFHPDEAAAEAANAGQSVTFTHTGGHIGVNFWDSPYDDNEGPGVTWRLIRLPNPSTVSVAAVRSASEAGFDSERSGQFKITRSGGDVGESLAVTLHRAAGTARRTHDYFNLQDRFTFEPNQTEITTDVLPYVDGIAEPTETIVAYVKGDTGYYTDGSGGASITVTDGLSVDLDIDSNNNGVVTEVDEPIEDDASKPGKIIAVNDDDTDGDGLPDFADFDGIGGEQFVPVTVTLPPGVDASVARLRFIYDVSHLSEVVAANGGYEISGGSLRLWRKPGDAARTAADLIGHTDPFPPGGASATYHLEAVAPSAALGDKRIVVELDPDGPGGDGFLVSDAVRVTTIRLQFGVDGDRDGEIEFNGNDSTTAAKPYRFWLNNDADGEEAEGSGEPDSSRDTIAFARDLEDFAPLHMRYDTLLDAGSSVPRIALQFVPEAGTAPQVKLFRGVTTGDGYLTNPGIAEAQLDQINLDRVSLDFPVKVIGVDAETSLPHAAFNSEFTADPATFNGIFEGSQAGKGKLVARIYLEGNLIAERTVHLHLRDIKQMYEHYTVGDATDVGDPKLGAIPTEADFTADSGRYTENSVETNDYIVFVHGWRMKPEERRDFAETSYKRLFWQGYQGRFGMFSWPTDWVDLDGNWFTNAWNAIGDPGNYARSEEKAWHSGLALQQLLQDLKEQYGGAKGGKVSVFAHSMGNVVVGSALKNAATNNLGEIVDTYVASQAAMSAHAYDGSVANTPDAFGDSWWPDAGRVYPADFAGYLGGAEPYLHNIDDAAGKLVNFFNPDDAALETWLLNNNLKPQLPGFGTAYSHYDGIGYHRFENGVRTPIDFANNTYEMFAYAAESLARPLGKQQGVAGPFSEELDLRSLGFGSDHSAQFLSSNMERRDYWQELLTKFGLPVTA